MKPKKRQNKKRISFISFLIQNEDGSEIADVKQLIGKHHSLSSAQETVIETNTPNMVVGSGREVSFYKNVKFVLSFSCEDEMGNTHYYRATISIPSTKDFCRDPWQVECVG